MGRHRRTLADRVIQAAEGKLAAQKYVSPIDVLLGIGWLDPGVVKGWRQGHIDCLEAPPRASPPRISEAMRLFFLWGRGRGLLLAHYVARTPQRQTLRFSRSGDPTIERLYRTQWLSPHFSERQRERLVEKASRVPELVVIQPLHADWTCHRCNDSGNLLIMENAGPACLRCTGLDDLVFLPSGDASLTRRVKMRSTRHAVIVRFSKSRGRYERQGLLVEPQALAEGQCELDAKGR
jgi:hypothetical protein